ncbi:eukaryotic translation initiation factor-related [Zea mays]|nr:eukaryotic translation initiation factor-related [Zea mays]
MFWPVILSGFHQLAGLKVNLQRSSRRLKLCPLTLLLKELMVFQLVIEAQGVLIRRITGGILRRLMHIGLLVGRITGGSLEIWRSHRSNHAQSLRHGVSQWSLQSQRLQHLVLGKQQPRWSLRRPSQRPCLILHHRTG